MPAGCCLPSMAALSSWLAHLPLPPCHSLPCAAVGDTDLVRISIMSYDSPESSGKCLLAGTGAIWQVHLLAETKSEQHPTCALLPQPHSRTAGKQAANCVLTLPLLRPLPPRRLAPRRGRRPQRSHAV